MKFDVWIFAFVEKFAKVKIGVKCSPNCQDSIDRTVDAKRMKTKDSNETLGVF